MLRTLSPSCSGFTSIAAFLLTREVWNSRAGLLAACFIAIVPGYISRSVAGSYDNEGIAIFALLFTYFLWLKSVKTGSVFWATATALSYFYMVWGTEEEEGGREGGRGGEGRGREGGRGGGREGRERKGGEGREGGREEGQEDTALGK